MLLYNLNFHLTAVVPVNKEAALLVVIDPWKPVQEAIEPQRKEAY